MSLKQWYKSRYVYFVCALVFVMVAPLSAYIAGDTNEHLSINIVLVAFAFISIIGFALCMMRALNCYMGIIELQSHLGVHNVKQYIELPPSQMEDMCLKRLGVLAGAWQEAQRNCPMPFAEECVKAESAFRSAYLFFEGSKCIKPTKWDRFFTRPETRK